jgi:hypothetical protein
VLLGFRFLLYLSGAPSVLSVAALARDAAEHAESDP